MSQLAAARVFDPPRALAGKRMDRVVAWLNEPARRLYRMLHGMPGFSALRHVSLSVHEEATDMLWAFTISDGADHPLEVQEVDMAEMPSLALLAGETKPRIVADMAEFGETSRFHSTGARNSGCRSCMTMPIRYDGEFLGFVIFSASVPNFFGEAARDVLETYSEAFSILIHRALDATSIPS
jgi:hypothetical protein